MITEENFVDFKCPYCNGPVSFPQESVGFLRECPGCMQSLIVPEAGAELAREIPLPFKTPTLVLRRLQPGDWKALMELFGSEDEEQVLQWLERDAQIKLTTPEQTFCLGIEAQEGNKLIGYLGLRFTDAEHLQATFTLTIHPRFEHTDLVSEAVAALLRFCFQAIKLHRVTAMCDSGDAADCQLFERVGMRREGEFLKDRFVGDRWASTAWYALLNEEYQTKGQREPGQASE